MSSKEPIDFKAYNNMFAKTFRMPSYADTKKVAAMTEMPAFQDVHLNMGRKKDYDDAIINGAYEEARYEGELLDKKSLLNYSLELYKTWKMSDYRCDVFVINKENNEIVGRLISHLGSEGDYPIIASTVVYKKHQKQGLGMLMYTMLIDSLGGCYSDRTLTGEYGGGSFRVWELLGQKYNSYTVSRDKKAKRNIIVKANGFSQDMMGDPDEKFLVTKDPIPEDKLSDPNKELAAMTEMPEFSDKDKVLGDDESFLPPLHATLVKTFGIDIPGVGKGKAELYRFISNSEEKELLLYMPNGEGCAVMQYDATKDSDMPFPVISFCAVKESYRGKGLSKILYDFIIKLHKGIISDATLTGEDGYGSFQVWQSLNKKYKTYIVNTVNGIINPLPIITREHMGDHNERFMVTLHPFDYVRHNEGKSLKEVQLMNHSGDHDIDSSDPNEWDFLSGKTLINKKIGKDMIFIKMKVQHNSDVKYAIKDIKNKVIITGMRAKIDSGDFKVNQNEAQITSVVTNPNYRGKGWGKLMYKLVLETEGTIVSDYQLYPGTYAIWKDYLPKIANVYNFNEDGELEPFDPVKGISKEGLYDYFVASKDKLL
jgi:GNAT superfamily N-acetyltransferase